MNARSSNTDATPVRGVSLCSECGCPCQNCVVNGGFVYQQEEIEKLRSLARSQQSSLNRLESDMHTEAACRSRELHKLQDELARLRDRYDRLLDSHKKLCRLNGGLEERLLAMADRLQADQAGLADCQQRLALSEAGERAALEEAAQLRREAHILQAQLPPPLSDDSTGAPLSRFSPGPSQQQAMMQPCSVSVPLPTFPPTFAHVPAPCGAARYSPLRQPPQPPQPLQPPQPPQPLGGQQWAKSLGASGSAVLHL